MKWLKFNRLLAFTVLALMTTPALAQDSIADVTEQPEQDEANNSIDEIIVRGRAQEFYLVRSSGVGTKFDADLNNLPQSVQVLNEQLIIDQAARNVTDLYRSIAGVSEFSYSGVTFRGFRDSGNVFYDGVRGDPFSGFSVPQLFNVERVEVLKGPAGSLYGGGEPGGLINYVTKKPDFENSIEVGLTVGNYDLFGGRLDARGPVSDNIAYRFAAYYEDQDDFRNNADARNIAVAGGLTFAFSENTDLTLTFDWMDQDLGGNRLRGVPVDDAGNFLVDRSYNANEAFDFQDLDATVIQANLDHRFSDQLTIKTTLRYLENDRTQKYHESRSWVDVNGDGEANIDDQTIRREYRDQFRANEELSLTTDLVYTVDVGKVEHIFLFGADFHDVDTNFDYLRARYEADNVANLNIFDLNYGITNPSTYNLTDLNRDGVQVQRYSAYVQDQMTFGERWIVLAGFRWDQFDDVNKSNEFSIDDSNISPRAGIVFKPIDATSLYVNYSETFEPASLGDQDDVIDDRVLNPETGTQIEIGIKQELLEGSIVGTLAIYDIDKKDIALRNPADTGPDDGIPALINLGAVESRGAEFTLVGDITPFWTITANYAYNDTRVIDGVVNDRIGNTFGDGSRFVNAPVHQAGLWTRFELESINSAIAFGADYVSEQISFSAQRVRPFTVYDMSWTTYWDKTQLQINVKNLLDEDYAVSGFSERNGHFPGTPREIVAQLTYRY
ncbi:MAG: TonB-dependent receptor [Pseudomonadota bacterium]